MFYILATQKRNKMIEYVTHEAYPDDNFIKESCTFTIDPKRRETWVRRIKKDGNTFWAPIETYATLNGEKKRLVSSKFESNFTHDDIINWLNARPWEKNKIAMTGNALNDDYQPSRPTASYNPNIAFGIEAQYAPPPTTTVRNNPILRESRVVHNEEPSYEQTSFACEIPPPF